VVEDASAVLIDLFADRAVADGDQPAADAIRAAKGAWRVEDRLRTAADALPTNLRPGCEPPKCSVHALQPRYSWPFGRAMPRRRTTALLRGGVHIQELAKANGGCR
jgi:hypothetical protein